MNWVTYLDLLALDLHEPTGLQVSGGLLVHKVDMLIVGRMVLEEQMFWFEDRPQTDPVSEPAQNVLIGAHGLPIPKVLPNFVADPT